MTRELERRLWVVLVSATLVGALLVAGELWSRELLAPGLFIARKAEFCPEYQWQWLTVLYWAALGGGSWWAWAAASRASTPLRRQVGWAWRFTLVLIGVTAPLQSLFSLGLSVLSRPLDPAILIVPVWFTVRHATLLWAFGAAGLGRRVPVMPPLLAIAGWALGTLTTAITVLFPPLPNPFRVKVPTAFEVVALGLCLAPLLLLVPLSRARARLSVGAWSALSLAWAIGLILFCQTSPWGVNTDDVFEAIRGIGPVFWLGGVMLLLFVDAERNEASQPAPAALPVPHALPPIGTNGAEGQ